MPQGDYSPLTPQELISKDVEELKGMVKDRREAVEKEKARAQERDRAEREMEQQRVQQREQQREREEKRDREEENGVSESPFYPLACFPFRSRTNFHRQVFMMLRGALILSGGFCETKQARWKRTTRIIWTTPPPPNTSNSPPAPAGIVA